VREGYSNVRIGLFLEAATTFGALFGAFIASWISTGVLAVVSDVSCCMRHGCPRAITDHRTRPRRDPLAEKLRLNGTTHRAQGLRAYYVQRVKTGFGLMLGAAWSPVCWASGRARSVIAMDRAMRIPFKVSTTTSNFMIGVTAAASAGVPASRLYRPPADDAGHVGRVDGVAIGGACVDGGKHSCAANGIRDWWA
jgi:uncharacterized membrane protein YfcA